MAGGDQQAFTEIVDHYSPVLYPYLLHWLKQVPLVEEVLQDIFISAWRNRHKLAGMENFSGYLYVIARNKANSALQELLRASKEKDLYALDELISSPQNSMEVKELTALLEKAVAALPPRRREVFLLHRHEGLTYEQIATRLQISRHTVKEHMVAALVFLKYYVREHAGIIISKN